MFCGKGGRERAGEESGGGESGREIRGYWQIGGKFYSFICLLFFLLFFSKERNLICISQEISFLFSKHVFFCLSLSERQNFSVFFTFPFSVYFRHGRTHISLVIASISLNNQYHRHFSLLRQSRRIMSYSYPCLITLINDIRI